MAACEWTYPAVVEKIIDGDTVRLTLDLGLRVHHVGNVRVRRINAPEIDTPAGKAAAQYAATILTPGMSVTFHSRALDKYGRPLGDIQLPGGGDYATAILAAGHAVTYP